MISDHSVSLQEESIGWQTAAGANDSLASVELSSRLVGGLGGGGAREDGDSPLCYTEILQKSGVGLAV